MPHSSESTGNYYQRYALSVNSYKTNSQQIAKIVIDQGYEICENNGISQYVKIDKEKLFVIDWIKANPPVNETTTNYYQRYNDAHDYALNKASFNKVVAEQGYSIKTSLDCENMWTLIAYS